MPPNQRNPIIDIADGHNSDDDHGTSKSKIRCAVLGCGMMGQEHCSYLVGFPDDVSIDFLCDPHEPSLQKCTKVIQEFRKANATPIMKLQSELELYEFADQIDLLVIATPNYQHTDTLLRWGQRNLTILLEKPVAVSQEQLDRLRSSPQGMVARIWVAMEYRFIPAIAKLIDLLPTVGDIKMVTIRENRFPFLHKIGEWNRDRNKTGDSLVEKCCHFFDLMRLITGKEANLDKVRALAQRGLNYHDEERTYPIPIIDAAYVTLPFQGNTILACLELCMYAEGSRHQEEVIVTGTKGRLEAYLPENKVYQFTRPDHVAWNDRSVPPPPASIGRHVYDCSNVAAVHNIDDAAALPAHTGHHYGSTAVEWYHLLHAIRVYEKTNRWNPMVSLNDGIRAVEIGIHATAAIVNETLED